MKYRRRRRRIDPFSTLLVFLAIGMTLTLAYQFSLYYADRPLPMADQSATARASDG
jgi:hypothetical protein